MPGNRTDYDLGSHSNHKTQTSVGLCSTPHAVNKKSKAKLTVKHPDTQKPIVPFVIEPSAGVDRGVLAVLTQGFTQQTTDGGREKVVLKIKPHLAPVKVCVTQTKGSDDIRQAAEQTAKDLRSSHIGVVQHTSVRDIGKTYTRQDAIGTPLVITFDDTNFANQNVTIRHRDDPRNQEIVSVDKLKERIRDFFMSPFQP